MRGLSFLQFVICLLLSIMVRVSPAKSQMQQHNVNQVAIMGWTDESHYLIRTFDSDKNPVIQSVDIITGKGVVVPPVKSEWDIISQSLPQGTTLTMNDVISPDTKSVILIEENDLFFFTIGDKGLRRLTNDNTPGVNARFSPDGKMIAYTKNKDLYVYDLVSNKEIRLTSDASAKIYNGYCSWVYMEEILERPSRYAAFWWSPDGNKIAYLRTDETDVPVFTLNRLEEPDGIHGLIEATPYPKPGDPNPKVKMGIADIATAKTVWVKTDYTIDQYIAWPFWTPDSKKLAIQVVNRDQNDIAIILADPASGEYNQIYNEHRKTWVRFYEDIYTERYMDTPQDNPEGYKDGSALTFVKNYKGKLFMTHGDMDDNVHMQNSIYLISRLEDEGKSFEFMLYPGGRHGWEGAKAVHSRNEENNFWLRSFFGK